MINAVLEAEQQSTSFTSQCRPSHLVARGMTSFRYYFPCSSRFHQIVVDCLLGWFNGRIHVVKLLLDQRRRVFRHG